MSPMRGTAITLLVCGAAALAGCGALETLLPGEPSPTPPLAPSGEPSPTPPAIGIASAATEVKYALIGALGEPFYCDPDYYPIARADESELAAQWFGQVDKSGEELQAILRQQNLPGSAGLTSDQLLAIYREHKRLNAINVSPMGEGYRFEMRVSEGDTGSLLVGTVDRAGRIKIESKETSFNTCPICLDGDTGIATPDGNVAVRDLRVGMLVWTMDNSGSRIVAPILRTVRVRVPLGHRMVHLVLEDGRELIASPGHPLADGQSLGTILAGDRLDNSPVVLAESVEWDGTYTYDLLPAGETGVYWANGILLGSTLSIAER